MIIIPIWTHLKKKCEKMSVKKNLGYLKHVRMISNNNIDIVCLSFFKTWQSLTVICVFLLLNLSCNIYSNQIMFSISLKKLNNIPRPRDSQMLVDKKLSIYGSNIPCVHRIPLLPWLTLSLVVELKGIQCNITSLKLLNYKQVNNCAPSFFLKKSFVDIINKYM